MQTEAIERLPTEIFPLATNASRAVAAEIADLIRARAAEGRRCVLGLATGSTPVGVYAELVRLHREDGLSFSNVVTFNVDEYFPMSRDAQQSYHRFMREHLFDHVDVPADAIHVPDGTIAPEDVAAYCDRYERAIADAGGIDLQILGIGRTGHVGFNEPGSRPDSRTRLITLDRVTRLDAASDFFGDAHVPRRAITMGVGTIFDARRICLLAFGEGKANIVAKAVEGPVTAAVPATFLQSHANASVFVDVAAAAKLARVQAPWMLGLSVDWTDDARVCNAVVWLALAAGKPILKLTDEDYNEHGLSDLLAALGGGGAYDINVDVFRALSATINGWPAGKPANRRRPGDVRRPCDDIFPKRVLIFSPHPDDDVISMGGTLIRLVDQGHEVHVAYQTSGNIAVFDSDAIRFAEFVAEFNARFHANAADAAPVERRIESMLRDKKPGQVDPPEVQTIKGWIRRGECRAAARDCGLAVDRLHFMDLPFYETGAVRKRPIGADDVRLTVGLLDQIRPHQVYAAGDLSDPHGTHRVCLDAVVQAFAQLDHVEWARACEVWLYRGAWQEWEPERIEMAVPLSPGESARKRAAIFKHQSQKDRAMFPGSDPREFWQRAEDRNRGTAAIFDQLGLAEYEGIEGFVRWRRAT